MIRPRSHLPVALLFAAPAFLLQSGCTAIADRSPAPVPAATAWQQGATADTWPDAQWWQSFRSPELDTFISTARSANLDLTAAIARVDQADAQARIARAPLFPSLEAAPSAERAKRITPTAMQGNDFALPLRASYELDFWGKNRAAARSARETARASRFDREVVSLTVVSNVAENYFQILGLRQRTAVAQQNLQNANEVLNGLQLQRAAGMATELDLAQQRTVVAAAGAAVAPLEQQLVQAEDSLAILLGESPEQLNSMLPAAATLEDISIPQITAGLPSRLLARRPDVRRAESDLAAASFDVDSARAEFFPDIGLTAEGGLESKMLSDLFNSAAFVFDVSASAAQQLFTGGRLTGRLAYTRARYRELVADYRKTALSAFADVEDALAATRRTSEEVAQRVSARDNARLAYQLAQTQARAGTLNVLTLLNVQAALFSAEDNLVQARLAELQARVTLFRALGGGWLEEPQNAALAATGSAGSR